MEITFLGANAVALTTKNAKLLFDPNVPGVEPKIDKYNVLALTHEQTVKAKDEQLVFDSPGEYEAKEVSLKGIAVRGHMDEEGKQTTTMYRIDVPGVRVAMTGHIYPELTDQQLEALGSVDVLILPVGGNGYTLDAEGAARVVRQIEPKIVIPTHYADKQVKYEVPQNELQPFLDELGVSTEEETKYKAKSGGFPEQLTVINLQRTS